MVKTARDRRLGIEGCMRLLSSTNFGRVAINEDHGPVVLPVNYVLDGGTVLFRTDEGLKLDAATRSASATFEVDHIDERERSGWSVMVRGRLEWVRDPAELERMRQLPVRPLAGGEKSEFVRLLPESVSGREIPVPDGLPAGWSQATELGHRWHGTDASDLGL